MKKQFFSLALFAAAWLAGGSVHAQSTPSQDDDGYYLLGSVDDVEWFANEVNVNHNVDIKGRLTSDIDYEDVENAHTPIGNDAALSFKFNGIFDGQYHRIKRMKINYVADNSKNTENVAFFGAVRGTATIKNLIIDKSCSITTSGTPCRAAGLIACLQTYGGEGNVCSILNCVNEADVTNHNGVAGGIIGAGTSQYAYFEMHNCVNTGKITSDNNKTTAFNGWNKGNEGGSPNKSSQVRNCYNLGELTAIDNNQQFFRGNFRDMNNSYDARYYGMQGTYISPSAVNSGELCYKLNQGETRGVPYTQDLSDPNSIPMPIPGPKVYRNTDYYCGATPTAKGSYTYSNTELTVDDVPASHSFSDETGLCTFCSYPKEDWKSASNDGYYHLSNATDVEWFSHMVRDAGHGAMNAKLDADINFGGVPNAHLPIGSSGKKYFGHFDGQNHRIIGMVLNTASKLNDRGYDGNGFFGSVRGGGTDSNSTLTNEVIIENLIIDASCSIEHDNNFAAGVVAHINSRNDNNSHIIIRYCGNEANVSSTGKNIAGILGCVEGTEVGLTIKQCYNTGNIVGRSGESAAICAWTGTPKDYLVKEFSGCWNIGEVTGIDGNGYNLVRAGKLNNELYPAVVNSVDLCTTNGGNQGKFTINTDNPVASGELCYLLNGDQSTITWTQDLGVEDMPNMWGTTSQVFQAGTKDCSGAAVDGVNYNNTSGETITLPHNINAEIGMCDVCYTQFQEPARDDDYYLLANAGNVEWLSEQVKNGGGAAFYAKLTNDIDFLNRENLHSPIGPTTGSKFKGVFDGQGYRIKNMIINRPSDNNIGFFGFLQGNASTLVKNLIIDSSCTITANNRVGGLTGSYQNPGGTITIENVVNEATINANQDAGGIFGGHEGGDPTIIVRNCVNKGTITASNDYPYAGALCCYLGRDEATSLIENFLNIGTINGHNGGNIGRHNISNVTNLIDLSDTDNKTQGTGSGLVAADVASGKLAWYLNNNDNQDGDAFYQTIGTDAYPMPFTKEGAVVYQNGNYSCPNTVESLAYSNTENITGNNTSHTNNTKGFCTYCDEVIPDHISAVDNFLPLSSSDDLVWFSAMVNAGNTTINGKLTSDVDMSSVTYTPIGNNTNRYHGTFDGSGHKVNLNIDANAYGQGFISIATGGATVKNLVVTGSVKNAGSKTAGIIAEAIGGGVVTIQNCGNEATIQGTSGETAAIVANNWGYQCTLNIENVYNIGDVSGTGDVSTICACQGNSSSVFKNVYNAGSVTGATGGNFVRTSSGTYTNCYSTILSNDNASIISTNTSAVESGELCYKLGAAFTQDLSQTSYPTFGSKQVILNGSYENVATALALGDTKSFGTNSDFDVTSVTMTRTLKGEKWNTFCVPFDMEISELGTGAEVKELTGATPNGENYNMTFSDATSIVAGKPYMVRVPNEVTSLNLGAKTIKGTITPATAGDVTFTGVYNNGNAPLGSFIISNNVFYLVDTDTNTDGISEVALKAFRGYITVDSGSGVKALTFDFDDDATGVSLMEDGRSQMEGGAIYNIAGQRINKMQKGINIVNGKKILK